MHIADSQRLSFRLFTQQDGEQLWLLDQDPEVMRFINGGKKNTKEDIKNIFLPRLAKFTNPEQGWGIWQVTDIASQAYLGWVLVRPMDFFTDEAKMKDIELGWRFFQKAWGKGYATEAANTIKAALAEHTDVDYFSAIALEDNTGSINIMKKLGMTFIKKELHKDPLGDMDVVYYQMPAK